MSQNNDCIDECASSRALLVRNIPPLSRGIGLKSTIRAFLKNVSPVFSSGFNIVLHRNVHGHVRNGCCVVVFDSATAAGNLLGDISEKCIPLEFEGVALEVGPAAGKLRDHFFSKMPFEYRRQMKLDSEATFSVTDDVSASKMASVLALFAKAAKPFGLASIVDSTACVGGNTIAFAEYFSDVTAVERDEARCALLEFNLSLAKQWRKEANVPLSSSLRVLHEDSLSNCERFDADVFFVDPPWGGSNYAAQIAEWQGDIKLDGHGSLIEWFAAACGCSLARPSAKVVALKVPHCFDSTLAAKRITSHPPKRYNCNSDRERCFPFRFHFGSTIMLVAAVASNSNAESSLWFANSGLDELVAAINDWHENSPIGLREHRPEFFDYDKQRWIQLKKWIPGASQARKGFGANTTPICD